MHQKKMGISMCSYIYKLCVEWQFRLLYVIVVFSVLVLFPSPSYAGPKFPALQKFLSIHEERDGVDSHKYKIENNTILLEHYYKGNIEVRGKVKINSLSKFKIMHTGSTSVRATTSCIAGKPYKQFFFCMEYEIEDLYSQNELRLSLSNAPSKYLNTATLAPTKKYLSLMDKANKEIAEKDNESIPKTKLGNSLKELINIINGYHKESKYRYVSLKGSKLQISRVYSNKTINYTIPINKVNFNYYWYRDGNARTTDAYFFSMLCKNNCISKGSKKMSELAMYAGTQRKSKALEKIEARFKNREQKDYLKYLHRMKKQKINIQQHLSDLGYDVGPPDGIFGRKTYDAIDKAEDDGVIERGLSTHELMNALTKKVEFIKHQQNLRSEQALHEKLSKKSVKSAYLWAGKLERKKQLEKARKVYKYIIDNYEEDDLALKANDRMLALEDALKKQNKVVRNQQRSSKKGPCSGLYAGKIINKNLTPTNSIGGALEMLNRGAFARYQAKVVGFSNSTGKVTLEDPRNGRIVEMRCSDLK